MSREIPDQKKANVLSDEDFDLLFPPNDPRNANLDYGSVYATNKFIERTFQEFRRLQAEAAESDDPERQALSGAMENIAIEAGLPE